MYLGNSIYQIGKYFCFFSKIVGNEICLTDYAKFVLSAILLTDKIFVYVITRANKLELNLE